MNNEITLYLNATYVKILLDALAYGHDALMESAGREPDAAEEERMKKQADILSEFMEELERARR